MLSRFLHMPTEINGYSPSEETALSSLIINEVDSNETFEKMRDKGLLQDNQLYLVTDESPLSDSSGVFIDPVSESLKYKDPQTGEIKEVRASNIDAYTKTETDTLLQKKATTPKYVSVTLAAASWDSTAKTQTVTVTGVKASETAQIITPTPALVSQMAYYEAGILCTAQAENSLTFTCTTAPTEDLTVYVVIQEVGA